MKPLRGIHVVSIACNLPGPLAVARLLELGASAVKVEPPAGDALHHARPDWYEELHHGAEVHRLDLKATENRSRLDIYLENADLFVTASRLSALERLGLSWDVLHGRFPKLSQVAIVGYFPPMDQVPGHDLTYQAGVGLLDPPKLPRTCLADIGGAQEAVSVALALLFARERGQGSGFACVSLGKAAETFADPFRRALTTPDGVLGGAFPGYNLYRAKDGWIAVAALEPRFWQTLQAKLQPPGLQYEDFQDVFSKRTAAEWEAWGVQHDVPIAAVRDALSASESVARR